MGAGIPEISAITKPDWQLSAARPVYGYFKRDAGRRAGGWDMHYGLEFGLICAGRQQRYFPGRFERTLGPGQVWLCNMWEPHGYAVAHPPCERIILFIWPPLLASLHFDEAPGFNGLAPFAAPPRLRPDVPAQMRRPMLECGRRLRAILRRRSPYQSALLRLVFLEMMLILCESWHPNRRRRVQRSAGRLERLNQVLRLVFNSRRFISTDEAARACGMERHAFSVFFKAWMNISFAEFALRYRLSTAAAQLADAAEPIKAIASGCGFADASHFSRIFKRHYTDSPQVYRGNRGLPKR